jgi:hypothetical protein
MTKTSNASFDYINFLYLTFLPFYVTECNHPLVVDAINCASRVESYEFFIFEDYISVVIMIYLKT